MTRFVRRLRLTEPPDSWSSVAFVAILIGVMLGAMGVYYDDIRLTAMIWIGACVGLVSGAAYRKVRARRSLTNATTPAS